MITTPPHRNEGRAKLMRLLDAAIRAPSGDNCQPWSFHLDGETRISIHTVPERAKSFFDYENCATSLSVGAVIENMRVQAASEGGKLQVQYPTGMGISQPITT